MRSAPVRLAADRGVAEVVSRALLARYERETRRPPMVTGEVEKVLGRPARTFATWVADHRAAWT